MYILYIGILISDALMQIEHFVMWMTDPNFCLAPTRLNHTWKQHISFTCSTIRYDTIQDAILTCSQKPTWVSLIYRTEPTTKKCKTEKKLKSNFVTLNICIVHVDYYLVIKLACQCQGTHASLRAAFNKVMVYHADSTMAFLARRTRRIYSQCPPSSMTRKDATNTMTSTMLRRRCWNDIDMPIV